MKKSQPRYLAVGLSPAVQKTIAFESFREGEVNRSLYYKVNASGKCINVCRVLTQAGNISHCLTVAGRENKSWFEEQCRKDSLEVTTVETSGRVRTCTSLLDQEKDLCTELVVNEPEEVSEQEEKLFWENFLKLSEQDYDCLIISGSRIKGFSGEIIPKMVETFKKAGRIVVADFRGADLHNSFFSEQIRPDYIKINEEEFFQTFPGYDELESGLKTVSDKYHCAFVISRGARSTLAVEQGEFLEVESKMVKPVNPIGCGDSMTAGLAQGVMEGRSLKEAVELGRDYATRNVLSIYPGWIIGDD